MAVDLVASDCQLGDTTLLVRGSRGEVSQLELLQCDYMLLFLPDAELGSADKSVR